MKSESPKTEQAGSLAVATGSPLHLQLHSMTMQRDYANQRADSIIGKLEELRKHSDALAAALAEAAGYLASVRTDRKSYIAGEPYALQTLDWADGAIEYAEKANALLEKHDSLSVANANRQTTLPESHE